MRAGSLRKLPSAGHTGQHIKVCMFSDLVKKKKKKRINGIIHLKKDVKLFLLFHIHC